MPAPQFTRRMNLSARFSGEEFLAVLSETGTAGAHALVARVRSALLESPPPASPITFSAGVAAHGPGMATAVDLLRAADRALYQAKADGRDCARTADAPLLAR